MSPYLYTFFEYMILETDGHPVVFGEYDAGKQKTLLVYNHYDVQPVDPLDEWENDPFSAEIKGNRIYARGSSDNKGTLMARIFGIVRSIQFFPIQYTPISLKFKRRLYCYASADGTSRVLFFVSFIDITVANAIIMNTGVNSG